MIPHLALSLLLPAAWLTWRHSRLVSGALWLTLATWLAYESIKWQWPGVWAAGHLEWMRSVSMVTGLVGAFELAQRAAARHVLATDPLRAFETWKEVNGSWTGAHAAVREASGRLAKGRPDILAALLVASMGVDLAALLIHRGASQWGPQPFFQVGVLLAMCAISVWPRRKS